MAALRKINLRLNLKLQALICTVLVSVNYAHAKDKAICVYQGQDGQLVMTPGINQVPVKYRKQARCGEAIRNQELVDPSQVNLSGTVRNESFSTSLGRVNLRWQRDSEATFGRTPNRAVIAAMRSVSRALQTPGFPDSLRNFSQEWNIVFMGEKVPLEQIPISLVTNCHPGWMVPPNKVYVVAERVSAGCGNESNSSKRLSEQESDALLERILIHEVGHALEYQLLGHQSPHSLQAEGFASWFEQYASRESAAVSSREVEGFYKQMAAESFKASPDHFNFSGSPYDYGRASMYFKVIEKRYGVGGLMDLYKMMRTEAGDVFISANKRWSLNPAQLNLAAKELVK
ncbi:hypothetical protein JNK13_09820 [bacterium]|nr:hypothetical protein [bacterium]